MRLYEYGVPVTSIDAEILAIAGLYRDRADCGNNFDVPESHLARGGLATADLERCRVMARMTAPVCNWRSIFARPGRDRAEPDKHREAIASRPLLLDAPARQSEHARQRHLAIGRVHAEAAWVERAYRKLAAFRHGLRLTAEQLTPLQRCYRILSRAMRKYLHGRQLQPPAPCRRRSAPAAAHNHVPCTASVGETRRPTSSTAPA